MIQSAQLLKSTVQLKNASTNICRRFISQLPKSLNHENAKTVSSRPFATVTLDPISFKPSTKNAMGSQIPKNEKPTIFRNHVQPPELPATFRLKTGQTFKAVSFGAPLKESVSGEVVFTTSLVGYPESMSDPSYRGQILVFTQPLIGNYGVPAMDKDEFGLFKHFESEKIHVKGIIVTDYAKKYSHWNAVESLGEWCARNNVPALSGVDTRAVVTLLREQGSTLGEIIIGDAKPAKELEDPNKRNLVAEVSVKSKKIYNKGGDVKIALIDCGAKQNIIRCLAKRGAEVHLVPWNHDVTKDSTHYDGIFISNGPGNPSYCEETIMNLRKLLIRESSKPVPTPNFGICMGNLLLGAAAGFETYKLPYGNRGHNQPAINLITNQCVITSQNHGFAIKDGEKDMVEGWEKYFVNANDGSNEGIRHKTLPFASVQYHPEAKAGPQDTEYLFEEYLDTVRESKKEYLRQKSKISKKQYPQIQVGAEVNISSQKQISESA
jgi:carbamoyl-phosphate synthase small subunit